MPKQKPIISSEVQQQKQWSDPILEGKLAVLNLVKNQFIHIDNFWSYQG